MNMGPVRLLLIEDSPSDALILTETLKGVMVSVQVTHVEKLSEGIAQLLEGDYDVVLLDLTLPDSDGFSTFETLHDKAPTVPVVVLTGLAREDVGIQALRMGAQDYLIKGQIDKELLSRSVRYAIERHQLQNALVIAREQEQNERELRSVAQLVGVSREHVLGVAAEVLQKRAPEVFKDLTERYQALLTMALERQVFKVEHGLSDRLRALGEDLSQVEAGPRDVIEIHTLALQDVQEEATAQKVQAYLMEGRLMVLELMGYLVSFYQARNRGKEANSG